MSKDDLHSLMVPGLSRDRRWRRAAYLLTGLLKFAFVIAIGVLLCVSSQPKDTIVIVTLVLMGTVVSALLDMLVYQSTMPEVIYLHNDEVDPIWFSTPFSHRHRLCVIANRLILLFTAIFISLVCAPPSVDWTLMGEDSDTRISSAVYGLLVANAFLPVITLFLWSSVSFAVWGICACLRQLVALIIVGIARKCIDHARYLSLAHDADFNLLPSTLRQQALLLLNTLLYNAALTGFLAYVGFALAMIAGWTRSKKWITWNINFILPTTLILAASFVTSAHLSMIKAMFCNYDLYFGNTEDYPKTSAFARRFCHAIRTSPRLNGQHWVTAALIVLNCFQLAHAILMVFRPEWQPNEWHIADRLRLMAKHQRGCQYEHFVSTLKQR